MTLARNTGVPLCDLHTQYQELRPQIEEAVGRVLASGQVILGPEVAGFEEELAAYCGARFGVGCASGSDALSHVACVYDRMVDRARSHLPTCRRGL